MRCGGCGIVFGWRGFLHAAYPVWTAEGTRDPLLLIRDFRNRSLDSSPKPFGFGHPARNPHFSPELADDADGVFQYSSLYCSSCGCVFFSSFLSVNRIRKGFHRQHRQHRQPGPNGDRLGQLVKQQLCSVLVKLKIVFIYFEFYGKVLSNHPKLDRENSSHEQEVLPFHVAS